MWQSRKYSGPARGLGATQIMTVHRTASLKTAELTYHLQSMTLERRGFWSEQCCSLYPEHQNAESNLQAQ